MIDNKILHWLVVATGIFCSSSLFAAEFQLLGKLRPTDQFSDAYAVSADGSTAVGVSFNNTNGYEAMRWTAAGVESLGAGQPSEAYGVSADGSVIVGRRPLPGSTEAFRWTAATGLVPLGDIPGGLFASGARDVSADGTVIAGYGYSDDVGEASRWTFATGMVGLGRVPGGDFGNSGNSISADGSVVAGIALRSAPPGPEREAFRWSAATGMVGLGDLPGGGLFSEAYGVSADGSIVVGRSTTDRPDFFAFRWTEATGMVELPPIADGTPFRSAEAISGDGKVIVGTGAIVWDQFHGSRVLADIVAAQGVDLDGWSLDVARGASFDGLTIVGVAGRGPGPGRESAAFMVRLEPGTFVPEPSSIVLCSAAFLALLTRLSPIPLYAKWRLRDNAQTS